MILSHIDIQASFNKLKKINTKKLNTCHQKSSKWLFCCLFLFLINILVFASLASLVFDISRHVIFSISMKKNFCSFNKIINLNKVKKKLKSVLKIHVNTLLQIFGHQLIVDYQFENFFCTQVISQSRSISKPYSFHHKLNGRDLCFEINKCKQFRLKKKIDNWMESIDPISNLGPNMLTLNGQCSIGRFPNASPIFKTKIHFAKKDSKIKEKKHKTKQIRDNT
ncbi:hypothetical protein RFI_01380 [Reticulomyxa filosa]|uniref:Uncharacterized protein n=1 Tax=Reticulomyxa filosa TaxID=46433 RepID=X6PC53_RETFI|nr:hypothetical protein RFI_01380 [Reticulomyxa filosa]|eukprot:ETO35683.1 hypothetical protein RFI_01380 [Reticulomyxa filosa]